MTIVAVAEKRRLLLEKLLRKQGVEGMEQSIQRRTTEGPVPLSFAQERLWFLDQLDPGSAAYNLGAAVRLGGRFEIPAFAAALAAIVRRHEVLRTAYAPTGAGSAVQRIMPPSPFALPVIDLTALPSAWRETATLALARAEAGRPFALDRGPVLRVALLRLAAEEHVALLTFHHIAVDGWSLEIFMGELSALYGAALAGRPSPLPPLPIQYADFALWQRSWLSGRVLAEQVEHWRRTLAGLRELLELPTDRPRPAIQSVRGGHHSTTLPQPLAASLQDLGRRHGATLFMVLAAGWTALLQRWTGSDDIAVGTPVANRGRPEVEALIGFFANTLVLRVDLAADPTFAGLMARVGEVSLSAFGHQDMPFEKLVEELAPRRSLGHSPLFQVFFALQNTPVGAFESGGLRLSPVAVDGSAAKFDLSLSLVPGALGLIGRLEYCRDLFDAATVERLLSHFHSLLVAASVRPDARLSDLPLLSAVERHQLIEWNRTAAELPPGLCVHDLVACQAARTPDAIAVEDLAGGRLAYRELEARAEGLARRLSGLGVGPEVLVGVAVERSVEMLVSLLAVLKAGGGYVPLDPEFPAERLAYMVADSGLRVLLTEERLLARFAPEPGVTLVVLDREAGERMAAAPAVDVPRLPAGPGNVAYVIYTSGSTGWPKGVQVVHRGVVNFLLSMSRRPGLTAGDSLLAITTLSFDIAALELYLPLVVGGRVVVASREVASDGERLAAVLSRPDITVLQATPATWRMLLAAGWTGKPGLMALCGGEALPRDLADRLAGAADALWNVYGPTETTIWSTLERQTADGGPVSIGRPLANTRVLLLSGAAEPVPVGVAGELCIAGDGLARGYLGRPDLTAERFVPDPSPAGEGEPGGRLYRTGDLARRLPDGRLECLGRIDGQVKVRGFRIEPGEIELALAGHPAIRQAVVAARKMEDGERRLVAWVVAAGEAPPSSAELRAFLAARLPDYMVPGMFVHLDELPLTPNGKVDRRALPVPHAVARAGYLAPRNPVEQVLADIWGEVLGVERVGIEDDFFDLGGHSLLATRLVAALREAFQVDLRLRHLFGSPSVAQLAARIAQLKGRHTETDDPFAGLPALVAAAADLHQPFPLTDVQQAYWIGRSEAFELGKIATHTYFELESATLDLERVVTAWRQLIDRHPMLRAVVLRDGRQQILERVPPYQIEIEDLRELPAGEAEGRLAAVRERMSHQVLPSDRWPLFEIRASRFTEGRLRLHVSLDLLIGDAWSWRVLGEELAQLYRDPHAALPPLEISFRDYVLAEVELQQSPLYQRSRRYWRDRLATLPAAPQLPVGAARTAAGPPRFERRSGELPAPRWERLKARAMRFGLTPSAVLLAAFSEVLACWSKSPRFTINLTLFNRLPLHPQVHRLVGDFTSLTLLEVECAPEIGFADHARRVQERLWDDLDHRYFSGIKVLRELSRQQQGVAGALMPVVFTSILGLGNAHAEASPAAIAPPEDAPALDGVYAITQTPQVWLDHQVREAAGALRFNWDAVSDLFPAGLLDDMFAAYGQLLERLAGSDEAWRAVCPDLRAVEQSARITAVNATDSELPSQRLEELFLGQAARQPERPAVITPDRVLSYGDLERLARHYAGVLRRRGAAANHLVAVVMEKGWEQVVAVLAILEAGAAYLPVDAALPQERRWHLLAQGEVALALTQPWLAESLLWLDGVEALVVTSPPDSRVDDAEPTVDDETPARSVDDLAYVIFTSGSTGLPKGVMIDHQGAVNTVLDINRRWAVGEHDRVLALSALSFDLSVYDIFGLLAAGGAIVLPEPAAARDPGRWCELMAEHAVTVWNSVPALLEMLLEYARGTLPARPEALRLVLLSGDWIAVDLPDRLRALLPGARPVSLGGATEASIWSIYYPIGEVASDWPSIPYGFPLANQRWYVLDGAFRPRPTWVPGELYIAGIGLALGYWRDVEKTRARFITHPWTGERLYRTGDLGRYLPDGSIEFLGREDRQVKIQGYRIELGEIEAALKQHPAVRDAAVLAPGEREERRLVAYVVTEGGSRPTAPGTGPFAKLAFKLEQMGLRKDAGHFQLELPRPELSKDLVDEHFLRRRSYRRYRRESLPLSELASLLAPLMQVPVEGSAMPKRRYGSAGSLYPVQLYLYVKPDRVERLPAGIYYYHPRDHRLVQLSTGEGVGRELYVAVNRALFDAAAFSLFLIADLAAIRPVYGDDSLGYCMLEAGLITQLLETEAPTLQMGLCQTGGVDLDPVRPLFALSPSHVLLHSLVGGRIDPGQWRVEGALPEAGEEVAAEAGSSGLAGELTEFLRGKLPPYMVPPVFVPIDAMPLTANGKLDREALSRPGERTAAPQTAYVPPATELARRIAGIIREVLKVERVGLYDNFFDMGGNSLHVVRAHQRLQEELGREFPLVSVFQHPNVQALTDYFGAGDDTPSPRPRQGLDRGRRRRQTLLARQPELPAEGAAERIPEAVRRDAE